MGTRVSIAGPGMGVEILALADGSYQLVCPVRIPYESHGRHEMRPLRYKVSRNIKSLSLWSIYNLFYLLVFLISVLLGLEALHLTSVVTL